MVMQPFVDSGFLLVTAAISLVAYALIAWDLRSATPRVTAFAAALLLAGAVIYAESVVMVDPPWWHCQFFEPWSYWWYFWGCN